MTKHKGDWVIIIIGLAIIASSLPSAMEKLDYVNKSKFAVGTVIDTAEEDYHNSHYSKPIVKFTTSDGKTQQFKASMMSSPQKYFVGDQVEVIYDPNNIAEADINSQIDIWSEPGSKAIFGLFFIVVGIFGKGRKRNA